MDILRNWKETYLSCGTKGGRCSNLCEVAQ